MYTHKQIEGKYKNLIFTLFSSNQNFIQVSVLQLLYKGQVSMGKKALQFS